MATDDSQQNVRERIEKGGEELNERVVELLSWVLDTETRARIYVYLREHPNSTSKEIADGTGLYPSTVREALAELTDDERVERHKRASSGAGNNPYEYEAIAPADLVGDVIEDVQGELNTVFNLDAFLADESAAADPADGPITIHLDGEDGE